MNRFAFGFDFGKAKRKIEAGRYRARAMARRGAPANEGRSRGVIVSPHFRRKRQYTVVGAARDIQRDMQRKMLRKTRLRETGGMEMAASGKQGSAIYLSHGGGPLPMLGDAQHAAMVGFMTEFARSRRTPDSILVVSAHWEERVPSIVASANPPLLYDYYGFPREAYTLNYPLPGNPALAGRIRDSFAAAGIESELETGRGFDHGVFIPLMLMYPEDPIPTVQLSLIKGLDPARHIEMGRALKGLLNENILIIGSGFSYHNMNAFFSGGDAGDQRNDLFQDRLIETCTRSTSMDAAEKDLIEWEKIPHARYCHPREEHLLPLHACFGAAASPESAGKIVFDDRILGKRAIAVLWD